MRQLHLLFAGTALLCLAGWTLSATGPDNGAAPDWFRPVPDQEAVGVYGGQTGCNGSAYVKIVNGGCGLAGKQNKNPDCSFTQGYCPQKDTFQRTGAGPNKVQAVNFCFECGGTQCGSYIKACDVVPCASPPVVCTDTN